MTQEEDTRVHVIGELCQKAEKMAQKLYDLISEDQGHYFYAQNLRFERPNDGGANDFIATFDDLKAYARYRKMAKQAGDLVSVVGRYEIFMVERIPFQSPKLSAVAIAKIDIHGDGKCIIGEQIYSLFPSPESFNFREGFQKMFTGRIATYMQNSLFD